MTKEILFVVTMIAVIFGGVIYIDKNADNGCVDFYFSKACGANIKK